MFKRGDKVMWDGVVPNVLKCLERKAIVTEVERRSDCYPYSIAFINDSGDIELWWVLEDNLKPTEGE